MRRMRRTGGGNYGLDEAHDLRIAHTSALVAALLCTTLADARKGSTPLLGLFIASSNTEAARLCVRVCDVRCASVRVCGVRECYAISGHFATCVYFHYK